MSHTWVVSLSLTVLISFFTDFLHPGTGHGFLPPRVQVSKVGGRVCSGWFQSEVLHYVEGIGEGRVCSGWFFIWWVRYQVIQLLHGVDQGREAGSESYVHNRGELLMRHRALIMSRGVYFGLHPSLEGEILPSGPEPSSK